MKSEKIWTDMHRRYAVLFLVVGLLCAVGAVAAILGAASLVDEQGAREAVGTITVTVFAFVLVVGIFATLHARRLNRQAQFGRGDARVK
ncbi:hypothetical protein D4740_04595 [Actinomyces sp. 2119]|nr:hypothetical protein D4740_04595 [Actinomyces sp. 2119]